MGTGCSVLALMLAACQSLPSAPPRACGDFDNAPALPLPPAAAAPAAAGKHGPLRYADRVPVNGGVGDIGRWQPAREGWQAWRLKLSSESARSMAVHVQPFMLPPGAEAWVCGPDGARHGPFRGRGPAGDAQLWSPQVGGSELWLEVLAPAAQTQHVTLKIVAAFTGYR